MIIFTVYLKHFLLIQIHAFILALSVQILFGALHFDCCFWSVCVSSLCPDSWGALCLPSWAPIRKKVHLFDFRTECTTVSFLPAYKEQEKVWKREDCCLHMKKKEGGEFWRRHQRGVLQQRCMWDGASAGGLFPLQGVSGPDATLMSCSKLRFSGAGQSTVVCVLASWIHGVLCFNYETSVSHIKHHPELIELIALSGFSVPFLLVYCHQTHQHCIIWVSFVFGAKAPTFKVWPWLASVLHPFINGELCGCALLIPQAEVEHVWRRKVLLSRSF